MWQKGIGRVPDVLMLIVVNVSLGVAANLVTDYLKKLFTNHRVRGIQIHEEEVDIDDEGAIKRIVTRTLEIDE